MPPWTDGNPVQIAEQFGHSVDQMKTHYKALVTRTDAERSWGLIPKADSKRRHDEYDLDRRKEEL